MKFPSEVTDAMIMDEFRVVADGVDTHLYAFVLEQIMYNLNVSEYRVAEALKSYIAWKHAENVLGHIGRSFGDTTSKPELITGHVYVFRHSGIYKIGMSNDVQTRLAAMNRGIPPGSNKIELQFEFLVVNPGRVEKRLHNMYSTSRIYSETGGQEWFRLSDEDLEFIFSYLEARSVITSRYLGAIS